MAILVHYNHDNYSPPEEKELIPFLEELIQEEKYEPGNINIIYTDNSEILSLNRQYLNHDYYTDVITFDYNEEWMLHGDIFISLDKIQENAKDYNTSFFDECLRVIIHGVLHLAGFKDATREQKEQMRSKEDYYLKKFYQKQ